MTQIKIDATQLANWDFMNQLPVKIPSGRGRKSLGSTEKTALKAALSLGTTLGVSPLLSTASEILSLSEPPKPTVSLLKPAINLISSTVAIRFSSSVDITGALALAGSLGAVDTAIGSFGFYGSTTPEVGFFSSIGAGITFNTPGAAAGGELTVIMGGPSDFAGPYFGVSVGAGTGVGGAVTFLFSPTLGGTPPLILTFMGLAFNISAVTPTKFPVNITIMVTNTRISGVKF